MPAKHPHDQHRMAPLALVAAAGGEGEPVLLLHGQPGSGSDWLPLIRELRRRRVPLLVPDRPGYGRTGGPAGGFFENADALVEMLDRLGVERVVVVGHSWGGGVAVALAARYPERVSRLVLVAPVGHRRAVGILDRLLALPGVGEVASRAGFAALRASLGVRPLRAALAHNMGGVEPAQLERSARRLFGPSAARSFADEQRSLVTETPALEAVLGSISAPTTVVVGADDRLVPPAAAEAVARMIAGAELVEVPAAGHLLPLTAPLALAQILAPTLA
jgi:4,5:9,10-diseco-3-hydroxy-5,9,17-trioxoandrosta-1(10),2-diene-4-oate hydrolase